ncbi:hypothetical protein [Chamaesiphon sp.]|uniref:hypothetical protein n=1 Tax=Chamaesiphon sp. TaxID=2814140 RepID=UPI003593A9A2
MMPNICILGTIDPFDPRLTLTPYSLLTQKIDHSPSTIHDPPSTIHHSPFTIHPLP